MLFDLGADPKSVVCAFFKQGQCTKGDKCKFSHDLTLERKCEKRSVYIDARDEELEKGIFFLRYILKVNLFWFVVTNIFSSLKTISVLVGLFVLKNSLLF